MNRQIRFGFPTGLVLGDVFFFWAGLHNQIRCELLRLYSKSNPYESAMGMFVSVMEVTPKSGSRK